MNHVSATRLDRLVNRHTVDCWRPLRHPTYNRFGARPKSFNNWPKHGEAPSPASYSEAGFYYDGTHRHNFEYLFLFQFHIFILLIHNFSLQVDLTKNVLPLWYRVVWLEPLRQRVSRTRALVTVLSICMRHQRSHFRSEYHSMWHTNRLISVCRSCQVTENTLNEY